MQAGAKFADIQMEEGAFEFWFIMWFTAPIIIWFLLLGNFCYWILVPIMNFLKPFLWE